MFQIKSNPNVPTIVQWKNVLQSAINGTDKCPDIQSAINCESSISTIINNCKSRPNELLVFNDTRFAKYASLLKTAQSKNNETKPLKKAHNNETNADSNFNNVWKMQVVQ